MSETDVEATIRAWGDSVVVGLSLCPFAARPLQDGRVRIVVCDAADPIDVLETLQTELDRLADDDAVETTLIAIPGLFADFADFNDFLDPVDALIERFGWEGEFQVASFHPDYCFDGEAVDDPSQFTNRAPFPILHLLREASIEAVLEHYPDDPASIPENNARVLRGLPPARLAALFPWVRSLPSG